MFTMFKAGAKNLNMNDDPNCRLKFIRSTILFFMFLLTFRVSQNSSDLCWLVRRCWKQRFKSANSFWWLGEGKSKPLTQDSELPGPTLSCMLSRNCFLLGTTAMLSGPHDKETFLRAARDSKTLQTNLWRYWRFKFIRWYMRWNKMIYEMKLHYVKWNKMIWSERRWYEMKRQKMKIWIFEIMFLNIIIPFVYLQLENSASKSGHPHTFKLSQFVKEILLQFSSGN